VAHCKVLVGAAYQICVLAGMWLCGKGVSGSETEEAELGVYVGREDG